MHMFVRSRDRQLSARAARPDASAARRGATVARRDSRGLLQAPGAAGSGPPSRTTAAAPRGPRLAPGIAPGVAAGLLWGLAFVVPPQLPGVPALDLTLGRYLVYGLLSAGLLLRELPVVRGLGRREWLAALVFAAAGNVGYYLLLVLAIDQAGAP